MAYHRYTFNPEVVVVTANNPFGGKVKGGRNMSRRRRKHRRVHRYNRGGCRVKAYARKCHRKSRRSRKGRRKGRGRKVGSYARFVKAHKGIFKKMSPRAAMRKIASMWRKKH